MDLGKLPLFSMMSQRIAWLGKRQQVLAQNVANADTPGYLARDLKQPSFRDLLGTGRGQGIAMAATQSNHIAPKGGAGDPASRFKAAEDGDAEMSLSGNSVDVEQQMMKVAQTAMDHQATVNLYRKHIAMIKAALGRNGV
jgi:flagellar basal-body rod protein FlgB